MRTTGVLATLLAVVAIGLTGLPQAEAAAVTAPNAPTNLNALTGAADGVVLNWRPPLGGPPVTGYEIQRAADVKASFATIATAGPDVRRYHDLTASSGLVYRVRAVNGSAASEPSRLRSIERTRLPSPGGTTQFVLNGAPGSPWEDGLAFVGDQVSVQRVDDTRFVVRGQTVADSPQGERDVSFTIGSAGYGKRLEQTNPWTMYPTAGPDEPQAELPALYPNGAGRCADNLGELAVTRADFTADGTPLALSLSFTYCGTGGHLAWRAPGVAPTFVHASPSRLDLVDSPRTLTVRGVGGNVVLKSARLDGGEGYSITADSCSDTTLVPGGTCAVTVEKSAAVAPVARLVLAGQYGDLLSRTVVAGPGRPEAPTFRHVGRGSSLGGRLAWSPAPSDPPVTGYTLYSAAEGGEPTKLAALPATATSYLDRTATASYKSYWLSASNAFGEGPRSTVANVAREHVRALAATDRWRDTTDRDIAVIAGYGSVDRLTFDAGDHVEPAVLPDDSAFVYAGNRGNNPADYDLWIAPMDGGAPQRLTADPTTTDRDPAASPDGTVVAFTRTGADGSTSIWTVPTAGGAATRIASTAGDSDPAWVPSGNMIAVSHRDSAGSSIALISRAGGFRRVLAQAAPDQPALVDPVWRLSGSSYDIGWLERGNGTTAIVEANPYGYPGADRFAEAGTEYRSHASGVSSRPGEPIFEAWSADGSATLWTTANGPLQGSESAVYETPAMLGANATVGPLNAYGSELIDATPGDTKVALAWRSGQTPTYSAYWVVRRTAANAAAALTGPTDGLAVYEGPMLSATAAGLVNGSTYTFVAYGVNNVGDVLESMTIRATALAPPKVTPSGSALSALSGDGPKFTARWGPTLGRTGTYEVQLATGSGSGSSYRASSFATTYAGSATSKTITAKRGTTYHLRARAKDAFGNVGPWGPTSLATVPHDANIFKKTGTWTEQTGRKGHFLGTVLITKKPGAALTAKVESSSLALLADFCSKCGKLGIYVDGKLVKTINTYAKSTKVRRVVWSATYSSVKTRSLKIVVMKGKRSEARVDGLATTR